MSQGEGETQTDVQVNDEGQGQWNNDEKKRHEYFARELQRLQKSLGQERNKQKKPAVKDYSPDIYTSMAPYCNTEIAEYVFNMTDEPRRGHATRPTSIGLCDPWVDHKMDTQVLDRQKPKTLSPLPDGKLKQKKDDKRPPKEGSTHLPKFPAVNMDTQELAAKKLDYKDLPNLRQEIKTKYINTAKKKTEDDYIRTKQDFYRMELDKLNEVHPLNRPHILTTYYAYLQNTPGSKKAIQECVRIIEKENAEKAAAEAQQQQAEQGEQEPTEQGMQEPTEPETAEQENTEQPPGDEQPTAATEEGGQE